MKDTEYSYIKQQVLALTGIDLNHYKAPQMHRRLTAYLKQSGLPNWPKLFWSLKADPLALSKFKDYLTINVSAVFRDKEKYQYLQHVILPDLLKQQKPLRLWSAGCSRGQEAYSLAILLAELSGSNHRHRIFASDVDQSALQWAKAGGPYTPVEMENVSEILRLKYFSQKQDSYWVIDTIKRSIMFRQHNLLNDPFIGRFDVIACRNVVIYFEAETKDKLYSRFYQALRPGGVLFVGGTEIIFNATKIGFESAGISFYRRKP